MEQDGVFTKVNDSIRQLASDGPATQTWDFICECSELSCHVLVTLTLTEFDMRRAASPPVPVLATHHNGHGPA